MNKLKEGSPISLGLAITLVTVSLVLVSLVIWERRMTDQAYLSPKVLQVPSGPLAGATPDSHLGLKFTTARSSGNLTGLKGANAKCAAEYPGYRFCTTAGLNAAGGSLPDPLNFVNPFVGGWIQDDQAPTYNCNNWSTNDSDTHGGRLFVSGSTVSRWWLYRDGDQTCNTSLPLCCYHP